MQSGLRLECLRTARSDWPLCCDNWLYSRVEILFDEDVWPAGWGDESVFWDTLGSKVLPSYSRALPPPHLIPFSQYLMHSTLIHMKSGNDQYVLKTQKIVKKELKMLHQEPKSSSTCAQSHCCEKGRKPSPCYIARWSFMWYSYSEVSAQQPCPNSEGLLYENRCFVSGGLTICVLNSWILDLTQELLQYL